MTEKYSWGSRPPAQQVIKLQAALAKVSARREAAIESHRQALGEFEETERQLKGEIRAATVLIERERRDLAASEMSRVLEKMIRAGKIDPSLLENTAKLEERISKALAVPSSKPAKAQADGGAVS